MADWINESEAYERIKRRKPLVAHVAVDQTIDHNGLRPTVVFEENPTGYNHKVVKTLDPSLPIARFKDVDLQAVRDRISEREKDIADMERYLLLKHREKDRHGCQDAASDMRDIESEIIGMRFVLKVFGFE